MTSLVRRLDPWPTLRGAPIALPQLLAILALITLSAAEGGFPLEHWAPAAVLISLLLIVSIFALPAGTRRSRTSRLAIVLIAAFAVWTALSLRWADDVGAAAVASTRTALLAATFVLFARWRHAPRTSSALLTVLTVGFGILAWGVLFKLRAADSVDPWFLYDRLLEPIGYVNAGAAFWGIAAFLAVGLLGGALPAGSRIAGALVVVPAASLSLLCLSRGGLLSSAIVVVLLLLVLPGRARNAAAFGIAGLGVLVAAPALLDVGDAVRFSADAPAVLHTAVVRVFGGTFVALIATLAWIRIERTVAVTDPLRPRAARIGASLLAVAAVVAVVAAFAGVGPVTVTKIRDGAETITKSYAEQSSTAESRLGAGLNSGRWDFWTVAWHQFEKAPLIGDGADNYRQDYLLEGASPENPRFPHSMWLRSLGQLGLIGTLLLLGWVVAVAVAVRRLAATVDPAARAVALAGGGAFGLWVVHGSVDWLMEFGGLSAIVAAVAGLVVASLPAAPTPGAPRDGDATTAESDPRTNATDEGSALDRLVAEEAAKRAAADQSEREAVVAAATDHDSSRDDSVRHDDSVRGDVSARDDDSARDDGILEPLPPRRSSRTIGLPTSPAALMPPVAILLLLVTALWSATQWVADRDRTAAAVLAADQPRRAVDRAERARSLEPFGEQADLLLGALAIKRGDLVDARAAYLRAYETNPRAARPRLWLGVLSSAEGDRREARRWLRRASRVAPRDSIVAGLAQQVKDGQQLQPEAVQQMLADRTAQLVRDPDPVAPANPPSPDTTAPAAAG